MHDELMWALSPQRLEPYLKACGGDRTAAFVLYGIGGLLVPLLLLFLWLRLRRPQSLPGPTAPGG